MSNKVLLSAVSQAFHDKKNLPERDRKKALTLFPSSMSEKEAGDIARSYAQGYIDSDKINDTVQAWLVLGKGFWSRVDSIKGCDVRNLRND